MPKLFKSRNSGGKVKEFFFETFRAHTKQEYSDFFNRKNSCTERGMQNGYGVKTTGICNNFYKTYPFVYVRAFAIAIIIFAIAVIVSVFTNYDTLFVFCVALGGLFVNLPVFLLVFELYPHKDVSFLKYSLISLSGGFSAIVLALLAYYFYTPENEWLSALYTACSEEILKLIPAVTAIVLLKNKSPLFGFLVGAAVGASVSVIEDMGYIESLSGAWGFWGNSYKSLVEVSAVRAASSFCTHTLWTALIGWAFCKFKRPYLNLRFYAVVIMCIALHFLWDLPLEEIYSALVCICCGVVGLAFGIAVLYKERETVFSSGKSNSAVSGEQIVNGEVAEQDVSHLSLKKSFNLSHIADLIAAICLTVLAVFTLGVSYSEWGFIDYKYIYFNSREEAIDYVQGGLPINVNEERAYVELSDVAENYAYEVNDYKLTEVTQREEEIADGRQFEYFYVYNFNYEEKTAQPEIFLNYVWLKVDGEICRLVNNKISETETFIYYKVVDADVDFDEAKQSYYVSESCDTYFYGLTESIITGGLMLIIFVGGTAAYITLKIKNRRNKNDGQ